MKSALKRRISLSSIENRAIKTDVEDAKLLLQVSYKLANGLVASGSPRRKARKRNAKDYDMKEDASSSKYLKSEHKSNIRRTPTTTRRTISPWDDMPAMPRDQSPAQKNVFLTPPRKSDNTLVSPLDSVNADPVGKETSNDPMIIPRTIRSPTESILGSSRVPSLLVHKLSSAKDMQARFDVMISDIPAVKICIEDIYRLFWTQLFPLLMQHGWRRLVSSTTMDGYRFVNGKRNVSVNSVLELVEHVQRTVMSAEVMEIEGAGLSSEARAVAIEQRRQIALLSLALLQRRRLLGKFTASLLRKIGLL